MKNNNLSGFHNIKLIQSKRQSPNLKKHLTKAEFGEVLSGTFNCSDKRCECYNYLLINDHYTFKNIQINFKLKNRFTCDTYNLIYVLICGTCKEKHIGENRDGKAKLRDRVRVYRQHIRQPQHQQLSYKVIRIYIYVCCYIYVYICIYVLFNLWTTAFWLFESSSTQLRPNDDLEGPDFSNY